jgi:hypothetical protein
MRRRRRTWDRTEPMKPHRAQLIRRTQPVVNPLFAFSFLESFLETLQDYLGEITEATLKDNFDIVYMVGVSPWRGGFTLHSTTTRSALDPRSALDAHSLSSGVWSVTRAITVHPALTRPTIRSSRPVLPSVPAIPSCPRPPSPSMSQGFPP